MRIVNVFDAVTEGNYKEFKRLYAGDINVIDEFSPNFNLLQSVFIKNNNEADRLKIIKYLIKNITETHYIGFFLIFWKEMLTIC